MKNLSLILNGVLIVAVGILYYLHFSTPKAQMAEVKEAKVEAEAENKLKIDTALVAEKVELPDLNQVSPARIAYVNLEELRKNLKFLNNELKKLEDELSAKQKAFYSKQEAFQKEVQDFQQSASMMTEAGIKTKEEELGKKQQQLYKEMQDLEYEAYNKEQNFQSNFLTKIDNYLKDLSKEKSYTYVFTYDKGNFSTIVFANDSLDITKQVIKGMNSRYK